VTWTSLSGLRCAGARLRLAVAGAGLRRPWLRRSGGWRVGRLRRRLVGGRGRPLRGLRRRRGTGLRGSARRRARLCGGRLLTGLRGGLLVVSRLRAALGLKRRAQLAGNGRLDRRRRALHELAEFLELREGRLAVDSDLGG